MKKVYVQELLQSLNPISLSGLDNVKLLNRVDRKYATPINGLPGIIDLLSTKYSILEIDGCRAFTYETSGFIHALCPGLYLYSYVLRAILKSDLPHF